MMIIPYFILLKLVVKYKYHTRNLTVSSHPKARRRSSGGGSWFSCQRLSMETPRQTDSERVQELIQKVAHVCGVIHTHIK